MSSDRPPRRDQPRWRRIPPPGSELPDAAPESDSTPETSPIAPVTAPAAAAPEPETVPPIAPEPAPPPAPPSAPRRVSAREAVAVARVTPPRVQYTDPSFGVLIAGALTIGLIPIVPEQADLRYVLVWALLGAFGVFGWVLGTTERIARERLDRLALGVVFGVIAGLPLLFFGGEPLQATVRLIFRAAALDNPTQLINLPAGAVLGLLIFAMPTAETLFFRGLMQNDRPFWLIGIISTIFNVFLFFPMMDVSQYPLVAVLIGTALALMNLLYSYVRERYGLAAAWLCQITLNVIVLGIPYLN